MGSSRWWRGLAVAAAVLDGGAVAIYLAVIDAQGDEALTDAGIVGWAAAMSVPGVLSALATATGPRVSSWLLGAAAVGAGGLGLLAILSVGLLFLAVAALSGAAALVCAGSTADPPPAAPHNSQA